MYVRFGMTLEGPRSMLITPARIPGRSRHVRNDRFTLRFRARAWKDNMKLPIIFSAGAMEPDDEQK